MLCVVEIVLLIILFSGATWNELHQYVPEMEVKRLYRDECKWAEPFKAVFESAVRLLTLRYALA